MADEKKQVEDLEADSEESRREFFTKAVTGAGAIAAAGLLAGAISSEAEAAETRRAAPLATRAKPVKTELVRQSALRYNKLEKGHSLEIRGKALSDVLDREGLRPEGAVGDEAVMGVSLIWD